MKIRDVVTSCLLLASTSFVVAQSVDNGFQLKTIKIEKKSDSLWVNFTANITPNATKNNYRLTLTPSLRQGEDESKLTPIIVRSKRMQIIDQRSGTDTQKEAYLTNNGSNIDYKAHIPYETWMKGSSLYINGISAGCCDSRTLEPLLLAENLISPKLDPVLPDFNSGASNNRLAAAESKLTAEHSFVAPIADYVIPNEDDIELSRDKNLILYFRVNESAVDTNYRENEGEISRLLVALNKIKETQGMKLAKIVVIGFASPEGSIETNRKLAKQRADGLVNCIVSRSQLPRSNFDIHDGIIAWGKLREYVATSTMIDKQAVLDIIDRTPIWDSSTKAGRQSKLQQFNNGRPYRYMKENFFPQLRTAGIVKVYYETENDVKAEAIDKSIKLIHDQQYQKAIEVLAGLDDDERVHSPLGICYMMLGEEESARFHLQKAAAIGDKTAIANLEKL